MGESWGLWSQTAGIATPKNYGDPSLGAKNSVLSSLVGIPPVARQGVSGRRCRTGGSPSPRSAVYLDVTQSHHRCLFPTAPLRRA